MISIITLGTSEMTAILNRAGEVIGDLMPLLIVIIGIAIAGFILQVILRLRG